MRLKTSDKGTEKKRDGRIKKKGKKELEITRRFIGSFENRFGRPNVVYRVTLVLLVTSAFTLRLVR